MAVETYGSQCNLTPFNYDIVIGLTMAYVDTNLKDLFGGGSTNPNKPTLRQTIYVKDTSGQVSAMAMDDFLAKSNNVNPFNFSSGIDATSLQSLRNAGFVAAFKTLLGCPPQYRGNWTSPIISSDAGWAQNVWFTAQFSEFEVYMVDPATSQWAFYEQTRNALPWFIQSNPTINLVVIEPGFYAAVPPAVFNSIKDPSNFSVKQLLFDLSNMAISGTPFFLNMPPPVVDFLQNLVNEKQPWTGWAQTNGLGPITLAYSVNAIPGKDSADLQITDYNFWVNEYSDSNGQIIANQSQQQQQHATLNYVCVISGDWLPQLQHMPWNWVPETDPSTAGVMAIRKDIFVNWVWARTRDAFRNGCKGCNPRNPMENYYTLDWVQENAPAPSLDAAAAPSVVSANYRHTSNSRPYINTHFDVSTSCFFNLNFVNDPAGTFNIFQRFQCTITVGHDGGTYQNVKVVDRQITDTFAMSVTTNGALTITRSNSSSTDLAGQFWNMPVIQYLNQQTRGACPTALAQGNNFIAPINIPSEPIGSTMAGIFFPNGSTFSYNSPRFSDAKDLLVNLSWRANN